MIINSSLSSSQPSKEVVRVFRVGKQHHSLRVKVELVDTKLGFVVNTYKQLSARGGRFYKSSPDSRKVFVKRDSAERFYISIHGEGVK